MKTRNLILGIALMFTYTAESQAGWYSSGSSGKEAFANAIEDYSGSCTMTSVPWFPHDICVSDSSDLDKCIDGVEKWVDYMADAGHGEWRYATDSSARPEQWQDEDDDNDYNDAADFSYFSGHGSTSSGASSRSRLVDRRLHASETYFGDHDLEHIAFDSCQTLNSTGRTDFINANRNAGVHTIMGFDSNARDIKTTASKYGLYLDNGYTVTNAWRSATKAGHTSSHRAAYVRFYTSACNTANDTASSSSCDPTSGSLASTATWSL